MNTLDRIVALLTSAALLITVGCSKPFKEKYVNHLIVNNSIEIRTLMDGNENKGITDIEKIISKSAVEEEWVYLPHKNVWIETGIESIPVAVTTGTDGCTRAGIKVDTRFIKRLINENSDLVMVHSHPNASILLDIYNRECDKKGLLPNKPDIDSWQTQMAIPSYNDIRIMIGFSGYFYNQHPRGRIISKIISERGITTYALTETGAEFYRKDPPGLTVAIIEYRIVVPSIRRCNQQLLLYSNPDIEETIHRCCSLLSNELVQVYFTPWRNYKNSEKKNK